MPSKPHLCPPWIGHLLVCPLRKLIDNPRPILKPHIKTGDTVMDVGSALGYFTLPMADLVGNSGSVIAVDIQQKMLDGLRKRARKAALEARIQTRLSRPGDLGVSDKLSSVDFVLAYAVLHEVEDQSALLSQIYDVMKPGSRLFFAEPKGHVSKKMFEREIQTAEGTGLVLEEKDTETKRLTALFRK